MNETKRLYKSNTDKRVWGVCGGLAEYFEVDPTLVRILFLVLTLAGGPGVLIYIVLGLVLPDAPDEYEYQYEGYDEKPKKRKNDELT